MTTDKAIQEASASETYHIRAQLSSLRGSVSVQTEGFRLWAHAHLSALTPVVCLRLLGCLGNLHRLLVTLPSVSSQPPLGGALWRGKKALVLPFIP